jgi:hypothetical protein
VPRRDRSDLARYMGSMHRPMHPKTSLYSWEHSIETSA